MLIISDKNFDKYYRPNLHSAIDLEEERRKNAHTHTRGEIATVLLVFYFFCWPICFDLRGFFYSYCSTANLQAAMWRERNTFFLSAFKLTTSNRKRSLEMHGHLNDCQNRWNFIKTVSSSCDKKLQKWTSIYVLSINFLCGTVALILIQIIYSKTYFQNEKKKKSKSHPISPSWVLSWWYLDDPWKMCFLRMACKSPLQNAAGWQINIINRLKIAF